jgi:hypothetical protein
MTASLAIVVGRIKIAARFLWYIGFMTHPIKPTVGYFKGGQLPRIACINKATVPLGVDFTKLLSAMQLYVTKYFAPIWGQTCLLVQSTKPIRSYWTMIFSDDADAANALGYHDIQYNGLPIAKIFVKTTITNGEKVSVTASHELAEFLVNPGINLCYQASDGTIYAAETADAVESESFNVNSIPMSDFVYPSWFEDFRTAGSTRFDHMGKCNSPYHILPGGYMPVFVNGKWGQIYGSRERAAKAIIEDRLRYLKPVSFQQRHPYNSFTGGGKGSAKNVDFKPLFAR